MTPPLGYDAFVANEPTEAFDVGATLRMLRTYRRTLLERCDDAKDCRAVEPDLEVSNQMEEVVQSLGRRALPIGQGHPCA